MSRASIDPRLRATGRREKAENGHPFSLRQRTAEPCAHLVHNDCHELKSADGVVAVHKRDDDNDRMTGAAPACGSSRDSNLQR